MAEKNRTVFQNLNQMMNLDGTGYNVDKPKENKRVIIRGNSPEEVKRKNLEFQQQRALENKFFKTVDHGFQKAMQYEAARLPAYLDYEGMEYYPLIASALDLMMEEATTIGEDGKMLKIYSDKARIKSHLEELFYDIVNVNVNLPFWTRNLPIREDSIIPLLDGTELTIKEISEKLKNEPDKEIWTYSIKEDTKDIVGGKIIWCDKTRMNSKLVRVHLDDETYIDTTPDHEFMTRAGNYVQAKDLQPNQSLMPFYTKESITPKDKINGYEKVYNPRSDHYKYTHSTIAHEFIRDLNYEKSINEIFDTHHVDFNKKNNHPSNVERLARSEYQKASKISKSKITNHKVASIEFLNETSDVYCMEVVGKNGEHDRHNFAVCSKDINGNYTRNGVFVSNCKYGDNFVYMLGEKKKGITVIKQMVNYEMERIERIHKGKAHVKFKQRETSDEFNIFEIAHFRLLGDDKYLPYGSSTLNKVRRVFRQLIMAEDAMLTYRIIRAGEKRVFKIDVGNIDEDDIEEYTQRIAARFKKQQQVHGDTGQIDYRFNILGNDEDYIIPVRNGNSQTGVDTLPGAQNLDQIQDIEYLRDNLFTGLGIPKPFLGFQNAAGDGKNMAQMDIRFAKKINRIQQAMIQELNKMAIIHLYLLGFSKEDLSNFTLSLTNPSTQQDLLKTELLQSKAQVYTELTRSEGGIAAMSHTTAKKKILNMSEKEIIDDLKMQRMERAVSQELQDSPLVIRETGVFTDVDAKYGSGEAPESDAIEGGGEPAGGEEGDVNIPPAGGGGEETPQSPNELPPVIGQGQGFKPDKKQPPLMNEKQYKDYGSKFDKFIDEMVTGENEKINSSKITKLMIKENENTNKKLNERALQMTSEIDELLKENNDKINTCDEPKIRNFESEKSKLDEDFDIMKLKVYDEKKEGE